ncbi:hypothetical protein CUV01_02130 [Paracoccus tegillarcae]|uniref:Uncharacterized protein n=2 Tax=Paracoccus tegillarcae TaxID=1529068 RepID=A0A2K9ENR5_9RHOB|nr:hypothetical protein CUV01_02130 [Paracoccus tegillarcae]
MLGYDSSLIITSPEFEDIVRDFNPEQVDTFENAIIGVIQSEKYGGPGFGVSDTSSQIAPGTYTPLQLQERFFSEKSLNGSDVSEKFILRQFGVEK